MAPRSNVRYLDVRSAELHNAADIPPDPLDVVVTGDPDLVAVADLVAVFGAVAEQCVPDLCDVCVIELVDAGGHRRVVRPAEPRHLPSTPAGPAREHVFEVRFSVPGPHPSEAADGPDAVAPCTGRAAFTWYHRMPDARDRFVLTLLVEDAAHTLAWQRTRSDSGRPGPKSTIWSTRCAPAARSGRRSGS